MELESYLKDVAKKIVKDKDILWIDIEKKEFRKVLKALKDRGIYLLTSISGVDSGDHLEVIYHLIHDSLSINMRVKVSKKENSIQTVTDLYPGVNLYERELSEMIGIKVKGHPNPKKLFLAEDSPEAPLRKP